MGKLKIAILYIVYIINLIINTAYCIYDLTGRRAFGKLEFMLIILFQLLSFVIFAELLHDKEKGKSKQNKSIFDEAKL